MEEQQKVWVDRNKEILTAIEVLRAPERLDEIGSVELGLARVPGDEQIKVIFSSRVNPSNTGGFWVNKRVLDALDALKLRTAFSWPKAS
jgi:hypothetical protein